MPDHTLHIAEILDEGGALKYRYSRYLSPDGQRWIRHGLFVAYHPNGRVATEVTYEHGAEHGPSRDYHPNGVVAAEGHYAGGKQVGEWRYFRDDGTLEGSETHA
jgi:antitoxin component YwqK of YwqJK toxin-antitoxin module